MNGQLNLLAPPPDDQVVVPICRSVLHAGARATAEGRGGARLFAHRHLPPLPPKLPEADAWLAALDFAEDQLRSKQAPRAIFDLEGASGTGCCGGRGGPSIPRLTSSSRGIEVDGILVSWTRLLAGRRAQREAEAGLARARDLAEAYRYLDYYGRVYGDGPPFSLGHKDWSPVPLIRRLAEEAIELGGDPARLETHTSYMRQGIREAAR